jgi:hypothetical protein
MIFDEVGSRSAATRERRLGVVGSSGAGRVSNMTDQQEKNSYKSLNLYYGRVLSSVEELSNRLPQGEWTPLDLRAALEFANAHRENSIELCKRMEELLDAVLREQDAASNSTPK